jgi:hypothetical protein
MAKGIAVIAVAMSAATTTLSGPALAATQFPSGEGGDIRVDWSGEWANANRLHDITLQLCDANPKDKNRATAQIQGYVTLGGNARIETAPSVFQVPIGDAECKAWREVFITYFQNQERLAYARVQFYGSQEPETKFWTRWVRNPFLDS